MLTVRNIHVRDYIGPTKRDPDASTNKKKNPLGMIEQREEPTKETFATSGDN